MTSALTGMMRAHGRGPVEERRGEERRGEEWRGEERRDWIAMSRMRSREEAEPDKVSCGCTCAHRGEYRDTAHTHSLLVFEREQSETRARRVGSSKESRRMKQGPERKRSWTRLHTTAHVHTEVNI